MPAEGLEMRDPDSLRPIVDLAADRDGLLTRAKVQ